MKHIAHSRRSRSFAHTAASWVFLPALVGVAGCGSDALSLGTDEAAVEESVCLAGEITGNIVVSTQAEVDALRGCQELPGSLRIRVPDDAPGSISLEPLSELRAVRQQLRISGPITSLAGLESLEVVGRLDLGSTLLEDLIPLRGLTRVGLPEDWRGPSVVIEDCDLLTDLRGLENLRSWRSLDISLSDALVSLAGLQAPELVDSVILYSSPQLRDVSALAPVVQAGNFTVGDTAVEGFDGFQLESVDTFSLYENPALTDLDGLDRLEAVGSMSITDNDALVRIELPDLDAYDAIQITGNDALLAVPAFDTDASWSAPVSALGTVPLAFTRALFEVGDNPLVTTIDMPNLVTIEQVVIYRNASLTGIDMNFLIRADALYIQENAVLASVAADSLYRVGELSIRNNPALSVAPFAAVQTFAKDVTGNIDTLAP
jgi:hypothetical protein